MKSRSSIALSAAMPAARSSRGSRARKYRLAPAPASTNTATTHIQSAGPTRTSPVGKRAQHTLPRREAGATQGPLQTLGQQALELRLDGGAHRGQEHAQAGGHVDLAGQQRDAAVHARAHEMQRVAFPAEIQAVALA